MGTMAGFPPWIRILQKEGNNSNLVGDSTLDLKDGAEDNERKVCAFDRISIRSSSIQL